MDNLNYFDNIDPEEDIDALNDETFGGDVGDINDDWEEEHEKEFGLQENSNQGPTTSAFDHSKSNLFKSSLSPIGRNQREDYSQYDFIENQLKTLMLDDEEISNFYPDFGKLSDSANGTPTKSKVQLNALKPPSPFILNYDDAHMSSVWKFEGDEKEIQPKAVTPKPPPAPPSNGLGGINGISSLPEKVIRLEDLEAQILSAPPPQQQSSTKTAKQPAPSNAPNQVPQPPPSFPLGPGLPPHPLLANHPLNMLSPQLLEGKIPPEMLKQLSMLNGGKMMPGGFPMPPFFPPMSAANYAKMGMPPPPPPGMINPSSKASTASTTASPKHHANQPPTTTANNDKRTSPTMSQKANSPHVDLSKQQTPKVPPFPPEMYFPSQMMGNVKAPFPPFFMPGMGPMPTPQQMASMMAANNMKMLPVFMNPLVQEQQRLIINKIITPAQAQRSYSNARQFDRRNIDRYAGFMTQREKDWLIKVFRLQTKVNDPYIEDYYEVSFNLKKSMIKKLEELYKQKFNDKQATELDIDSFIAAESLVVIPELTKGEEDKPKYIQFDNALGKIQVSNSRCPRKVVEIETSLNSPTADYKLCGHKQHLLKIERLYDNLLDIEDEDKRMPILPKQIVPEHMAKRRALCERIFSGLVRKVPNQDNSVGTRFILLNRMMPTFKRIDLELDPELLGINKGLLLVYRSLFQLHDEAYLMVILASLLKSANFKRFVLQAEEKNKAGYGGTLIKAIKRLRRTQSIMYIASNLDDVDIFTNNKVSLCCLESCPWKCNTNPLS